MLTRTIGHCQEAAEKGGSCFAFPAPPAGIDVPFVAIGGVLFALILTAIISFATADKSGVKKPRPQRSDFERKAYAFMRVSGIALLLLAVGHMLLQHIFRDVHDLTLEVVAGIWRSWGWRAYDLLLLVFAITHAFNGLRNILEDYIHSPRTVSIINRALLIFVIFTIAWSAVAIFSFQPDAIMAQAP
jgi:succinate dehydrogenase / fumarate reductase membrane anchor subunit